MCPENQASVLSNVFLAWFDSFAWKGYRKPINGNDLWNVDYKMKTAMISKRIELQWQLALEQLQR